jgi:tetratricopeptide (TPR) repeat protein
MLSSWSLFIAGIALVMFPAPPARTAPQAPGQDRLPAARPSEPAALQADSKTGLPTPPPLPPETLTFEQRGDIYMARKMYREAIETYRKAPQDSAVIWNKIGIAYHQMMEIDTAKKHYERALKLNPKYAEASNNLGTIFYAKRSYRKAVGQYKKALRLAPNSASIHSNLGTAHFARKKYKDATAAYQQALALDPDVFEHRSSYGVLLQERSVEERAKFHYYLARTYAQAGMNDRALLYVRKALEEGFKEKKKMLEDPEFAALRETPEFQQLLALEPRVL